MIDFPIFKPFLDRLRAGMTDRTMGSFKEDVQGFQEHVQKLGLGQPVLLQQTHSDIILTVDRPFSLNQLPEGDALITQKKDLLLMVKVADCQGIILYDPIKKVIGCVHSGWKGSVQNIVGKTILKMTESFQADPADLLVAISPSLGPCCSEFTDPKKELPEFCHPFILENNHVDFWQLSKKQCMDEGIPEAHIELPNQCTKCDPTFYSYRRGDEGRMAVFARMNMIA